jgi:hypothetical protein
MYTFKQRLFVLGITRDQPILIAKYDQESLDESNYHDGEVGTYKFVCYTSTAPVIFQVAISCFHQLCAHITISTCGTQIKNNGFLHDICQYGPTLRQIHAVRKVMECTDISYNNFVELLHGLTQWAEYSRAYGNPITLHDFLDGTYCNCYDRPLPVANTDIVLLYKSTEGIGFLRLASATATYANPFQVIYVNSLGENTQPVF